MELLTIAEIGIVLIMAIGVGITSFQYGITSAVELIIGILEEKKVVERVFINKNNYEIYAGVHQRFEDYEQISAGLYEFIRSEMIQGNLNAMKFYKTMMKDKDRHLKFLKAHDLPSTMDE